ncbi:MULTISPECIES: MmcQ/YjbR family DNA-binding protein [unclassified Zymobacter]|uniref:MmcQ/YjbR family DNA-binding protein n=1 Tax=unclassified Zymobacter TaxID=3048685 RepID=UPI0039C3489E
MSILQVLEYAQQRFGTLPDYPWARYPDHAVLRHAAHRKWYGLVARIPGERLGLSTADTVEILNVKVRPEHVGGLLMQDGIVPAYHMNKEHWVSVLLAQVAMEEVITLLEDSYALTA